jgi:hypothetical protein
MYVKRNTEVRSRNHCCHVKAISITYSEYMSVVLVIQHAKSMRRIIVKCGLYHIFPHYLIKVKILEKELLNIIHVF